MSQLSGRQTMLNLDGLKQMANMIAEIDPLDYRADEPARTSFQHGDTVNIPPFRLSELVDLIASLATEEFSDGPVATFHHVHRKLGRLLRQQGGVVRLRDADQKTRRMNAALGRESNEAAGAFMLYGRRDYIERVVQRHE